MFTQAVFANSAKLTTHDKITHTRTLSQSVGSDATTKRNQTETNTGAR